MINFDDLGIKTNFLHTIMKELLKISFILNYIHYFFKNNHILKTKENIFSASAFMQLDFVFLTFPSNFVHNDNSILKRKTP